MPLTNLPLELVSDILSLALQSYPTPTSLLVINSSISSLCRSLLYSDLRFRNITQLRLFSCGTAPLSSSPRSLTVTLAGGTADFELFSTLQKVLLRCCRTSEEHLSGNSRCLDLKLIRLRLNTHTSDPNLHLMYDALHIVNPEIFIWTGPDPDHHFSIAIVPSATPFLFDAISTWSNLRHLKLTNLSFPTDALAGFHTLSSSLLTQSLRNLQTLYLGQVTFLDPFEIVCIACASGLNSLSEIKVVDAYQESIWGPRVRNADIEKTATISYLLKRKVDFELISSEQDRLARVAQMVRCEARTERIMGGDRVAKVGTL